MASEVHQQVREFQLLISVLSSVHDTFYSFSFNIFISLFLRYVSYQYVDKNLKYLSFCLHTRMTDFCSFEFNFFSVYLWVSRSVCLSPPLHSFTLEITYCYYSSLRLLFHCLLILFLKPAVSLILLL